MMHDSFILQAYLDDLSLCDDLIAAHEAAPEKNPGRVHGPSGLGVDKTAKDSEDVLLYGVGLDRYVEAVQKIAQQYVHKYPQCNLYDSWGIVQLPQTQKYAPGGGFFEWHCERASAKLDITSTRHLVYMTYLNDVTDGGETEFALQNLKVRPKKGLTLIWPADWTHTHRGIPSPTQTKYIVTGWFNFV